MPNPAVPATLYYVTVKAAEDGSEPVRLAGPFSTARKAEARLAQLREEWPGAQLSAVWNEPPPADPAD